MKVYVGWDPRDELAFRACVSSLLAHSSIPLTIIPLKEYDIRRKGYYRRDYWVEQSGQMVDNADGRPFSTQFSFSRFLVPVIEKALGWTVFCDADFLWRDDIAKMVALFDDSKSLMCVKHTYEPLEKEKFDHMSQARYYRKNWSSLMAFNIPKCKIDKETVNKATGQFLHGMQWLDNNEIGGLPDAWNCLEGWSQNHSADISAFHYTRGTPDMLGDHLPHSQEWWKAVFDWRPTMNQHEVTA
jgi:hypothetical protein